MFKIYSIKNIFSSATLPACLIVAGFLFFNVRHAEAYVTLDVDAGARYSDNITNASSDAGKKTDVTSWADLSLGTFNVVEEYTGAGLGLDFKGTTSANFGGLNMVSTGLSARVTHKFGLGPEAVRLSVYGTGGREFFNDTTRNSDSFRAGLIASRWFGETFKLSIGYEYDRRLQLNNRGTICYGAYGATCYSTTVYDVAGNAGILGADVIVTEKDMLEFSYRHRSGDVVSSDFPSSQISGSSAAWAADGSFAGLTAYRLSAVTDSISAGVSHELFRKGSVNLDYTFYSTQAGGGINYRGNLLSLNLAYSM